jgi:predicted transposase/invertase (TIGR01784 family)
VTNLLDPKLDYVFKNIFGVESHKPLLLSFLNALLKGDPQIKDLTLTNTEFPKMSKDDKTSRIDVRATCSDRTEIDIEIQLYNTGEILDRALHYASDIVRGSLGKNESYVTVRVIGIWILNENVLGSERPDAINQAYMTFQPTAHASYGCMTKMIRVFFIELKKFNLEEADAQEILTAWLAFLKDPVLLNEDFLKIEEVKEAMDRLKYISADKKIRAEADRRLRGLNDRNSELTVATEKGKEKGKVEGKAEGIATEKKETAIRMLENNVSLGDISKYTGLSIEEIESLKK